MQINNLYIMIYIISLFFAKKYLHIEQFLCVTND